MPTPPPEFEQEVWLASVERMRGRRFGRLYLTHFGPADDVDAQWDTVARLVPAYVERVRAELQAGADRETIIARFTEYEAVRQAADGLSAADQALYASVGPLGMSVDGLLRYWKKRADSGN